MLNDRIIIWISITLTFILLNACMQENEGPDLQVSAIEPVRGPLGTEVTITGTGFSEIAVENIVFFNGILAKVLSATTTQLTVEVPEGAGTGPVQISCNSKTVNGPVFEYVLSTAVSTLAGNGLFGGQDGTRPEASFNHPRGIVASPFGELFITEEGGNRIRKVTPSGVVTTIAGDGNAGFTDGQGTSAEFNGPIDVEWIPANTLFPGIDNYLLVTDSKNNALRSINLTNNQVTTWAGNGAGFKDGDRSTVQFNLPANLTFLPEQQLIFISDYLNNRIRLFTNNYVSTVAGNSTVGLIDGAGTQASFAGPAGLASDASGSLYIADWFNHAIRKMSPSFQVTTIAGTGVPGFEEGTGSVAQFNTPSDVAVFESDSQLLVTDGFNHRIRIIELNTNTVGTLAGTGEAGYLDGRGDLAKFNGPVGIAVYDNIIYVTDYFNNRIRKIIKE